MIFAVTRTSDGKTQLVDDTNSLLTSIQHLHGLDGENLEVVITGTNYTLEEFKDLPPFEGWET